MHDSNSEVTTPMSDHAVAEEFFTAVAGFSQIIAGGNVYLVEAETFAQGAQTVRSRLADFANKSDDDEAALVLLLDRITAVALEINPRAWDIHRAAFEVAVRASQLAAALRDLTSPITWH